MSEVEATQRMMGNDFWPYGVEKNQKEIEAFIRYALEQGVIEKTMNAEDLFAENTLSTYKV
jgi:4,5-dihydroxyphthalate decarboxylase